MNFRSLAASIGCIVAAVFCGDAGLALCEGKDSHARSEYIRLRNLDPSGTQDIYAAQWQSLANEMNTEFMKSRDSVTPRALLFAADTHIRMWRRTRSPGYLGRAKAIVEHLTGPEHEASPEYPYGLVMRGDIAVASSEGERAASSWYTKAASFDGDVRKVAQDRLVSVSNGTFTLRFPSGDLEVPRPIPVRKQLRAVERRIVLDPGHGGVDGGAEGYGGMLEKDLTLDMARRVKEMLEARFPVSVVLTRTKDEFVPLARRTNYANRREATAFVSLHLNASPSHTLRGLEAYYLDTTDDDASRLLAERENGVAHGGAVDDLSFILSDLIQSGKLEESVELTHALESSVQRVAGAVYRDSKSYGVKKGPFFVLVGAHMPCSLIELFFIDNPSDGSKLATEGFRTIVSEGLASGLARFSGFRRGGDSEGPPAVAPAQKTKKSPRSKRKK